MSLWDSIAQRDIYRRSIQDFEEASYRIIAEQALYYSDKNCRAVYRIIEQYEKDFRSVLDQVGIDLSVNRDKRYIVAIPRYRTHAISTSATLTALVLRRLYDEYARQGYMTDDGEIFIDLIDFEEKFRLITNRQLPSKSEFEQIIRLIRRWGIARKTTSDEYAGDLANSYAIVIRPAIIEVLGEAALTRLLHWEESRTGEILEIQEAEEHSIEDSNTKEFLPDDEESIE